MYLMLIWRLQLLVAVELAYNPDNLNERVDFFNIKKVSGRLYFYLTICQLKMV